MATVITIAGVTKDVQSGSLQISYTANGRATASFDVFSTDGTYRPALDAEVVIAEDGTTIFGGIVDRVTEKGLGLLQGASAGILTTVNVADYNAYVERRIAITTIPAGTLAAALAQLVDEYLSEFGVTLHGSQVAGIDLPYLEYGGQPLPKVFNELAKRTSGDGEPFVWRIDHLKVLRMYQPSTAAAPFNIDGSALPIANVVGDIEVETAREKYANNIVGRIPATTTTPDIYVYASAGDPESWDHFHYFTDNPTEASAQEFVNALLARLDNEKKIVKYKTFAAGLLPGMSQTINVPRRNVNVNGVITEIVVSDFGKDRLIRTVTLTVDASDTNLDRGWRDTYKQWSDDNTGGAGAAAVTGEGGGGATPIGAAPPDQAVQFNRAGAFGGDAAFIYYELQNSIVCGGNGSSLTANDFESCQVFGSNTHIADPS